MSTDPRPQHQRDPAAEPLASGDLLSALGRLQDKETWQELHWEGTFAEYLAMVQENPNLSRNAYQRLYDLILSFGAETHTEFKKEITRYHFFDDPIEGGRDAVFGLDVHLEKLVRVLKSAALGYGTEKRVILLHGPVGSAKSTIARLLKKGLEWYSRQPEGALYTFSWHMPTGEIVDSPLNEDPLKLIPLELRDEILGRINARGRGRYPLKLEGELDPVSRFMFKRAMAECGGDLTEVLQLIRVRRMVLSERDRVGIGTFQPKDEKNQDSTELTGDINYRKIAEYGSDSDPRAFNFDGEFCVANRGIIEFVEMLKLDVAFLYDLLGASQEHVIKPKKFAQTSIDEVIIGHTNEPEYKKLQSNEFMEALRDRTIKIDIPYITTWKHESRIYQKDFNGRRVAAHIAPHTLEMAAMWAVLTRLEPPKKANLSIVQKLRLYDGKTLPGYTEDNVKELRKAAKREGLMGISPRYIQDKISNALVREADAHHINPFMVLNELEAGLDGHSLLSDEEVKKHYRDLLGMVKKEYEDIVKNEVQKAIASDEEAITRLCANYIDSVKAYTQKERVRNPYTGEYEDPDERLMRAVEEKIDIAENRKDDFRRELMNYIGALALDGKVFDFRMNERLHKALELKLFEDQKDSIKLTSLVSQVVDKETQAKIDVVKQRLIDRFGYDDQSATDVLNFVASIFARGDARSES
ncbi:MAG: serine protein kinase [Alphaproteobacteria bacterium]|nr:serine protein kinase [Alphaproteobacteria bacterium]